MSPVVHPTDTISHANPRPTRREAELHGSDEWIRLMFLSHHRCCLRSVSHYSKHISPFVTDTPSRAKPRAHLTSKTSCSYLNTMGHRPEISFIVFTKTHCGGFQLATKLTIEDVEQLLPCDKSKAPCLSGAGSSSVNLLPVSPAFLWHTHTQPSRSGFPLFWVLK